MKLTILASLCGGLLLSGCGTAMERAARSGDFGRVQGLIQSGKSADMNRATWDYAPTTIAAERGDLKMLKLFADKGAFADPKRTHPLLIAAINMQREACRFLIAQGLDVQATIDVIELYPTMAGAAAGIRLLKSLQTPETAPTPVAAPAHPVVRADLSPNFAAAERPNDLAVIVGIETYSDITSKASYAERDAEAFKAHVRALGVPERNIVLLTGSKAVRSALTKNIEGWLPRMAKPDSRVYFYFSGHGAPNVKSGQAYLVPWDGDPNFLDATAYSLAQLYKKLGDLPVKQVLVAMDSCFSGAGGRSVLASGARPLVGKIDTGAAPAKITVLAASAANEISGSLDDKGHGAFTYFLLEGMNAGKTTPQALSEYLTPRVQDEARRLNRDQTPQLLGDGAWSLR